MGDHCGQKAFWQGKKDGMRGGNRERERDRDMHFGIITALAEERRAQPLASLHQTLVLSLSTPGFNFSSTTCIPSSLSPSLQGSLSSLSHYFITSSLFLLSPSFTSLAPSSLAKRNTPLSPQPPLFFLSPFSSLNLSVSHFPRPKLLAVFVWSCDDGELTGRRFEQRSGERKWESKEETDEKVPRL